MITIVEAKIIMVALLILTIKEEETTHIVTIKDETKLLLAQIREESTTIAEITIPIATIKDEMKLRPVQLKEENTIQINPTILSVITLHLPIIREEATKVEEIQALAEVTIAETLAEAVTTEVHQ